jgi:hypothetical protein
VQSEAAIYRVMSCACRDGNMILGHRSGEQRRESAEVMAQRLLALELKRRGWKRKDPEVRHKADFKNQNSQTPAPGNGHDLGVDSGAGGHGGPRPRSQSSEGKEVKVTLCGADAFSEGAEPEQIEPRLDARQDELESSSTGKEGSYSLESII